MVRSSLATLSETYRRLRDRIRRIHLKLAP
jgi:hypothetical protein